MATTAASRRRRVLKYQDFLSPSLHRKFHEAALATLALCWLEGIIIGNSSSWFWWLFPIGPTGIRASLFFISVLLIFILRASNQHFGERTAVSPFADAAQLTKSFTIPKTLGYYLFSAWWFSEVYVWSANEEADLRWVKPDYDNGRDRLNERPIFLRSNMFLLAFVAAGLHLYHDIDQIEVQQFPMFGVATDQRSQHGALNTLKNGLLPRLKFAIKTAGAGTLANFILYIIGRRIPFTISLWFGRLVWDIPLSAEPSVIPPYHYTLIIRAFTSSGLLVILWEISNLAFSSWAGQPPLKENKPLTAGSNDPNGSLLTGIKSPRILAQTFALWELSLISSTFEDRRRTIFTEVDRANGTTWKQVLDSCLTLIEGMNTRLEDNREPPQDLNLATTNPNEVKKLPRLSAPLKADPILQASPKPVGRTQRAESELGTLVKHMSQPMANPKASPGRVILEKARNTLLSPEQQKHLGTDHLSVQAQSWISQAFSGKIGQPFRQTFARRVQVKVFGTPRSELPALLFAIHSIAELSVAAINEDSLGTVNRDIPLIMRTFGNVIGRIQKFIKESQSHWTDASQDQQQNQTRRVEEVEFLVGYLRSALRHIIKGYEGYARDMGIAPSELRAARLAAGLD